MIGPNSIVLSFEVPSFNTPPSFISHLEICICKGKSGTRWNRVLGLKLRVNDDDDGYSVQVQTLAALLMTDCMIITECTQHNTVLFPDPNYLQCLRSTESFCCLRRDMINSTSRNTVCSWIFRTAVGMKKVILMLCLVARVSNVGLVVSSDMVKCQCHFL